MKKFAERLLALLLTLTELRAITVTTLSPPISALNGAKTKGLEVFVHIRPSRLRI